MEQVGEVIKIVFGVGVGTVGLLTPATCAAPWITHPVSDAESPNAFTFTVAAFAAFVGRRVNPGCWGETFKIA
jgi:hypothetical protein